MIKVDENILYGGHVMTNERNRKHKKRKKEAEMNIFATKATFVAGIVVLITIVKDILELCIQIPVWGGAALFEHLFYCIYCRSMHNNC